MDCAVSALRLVRHSRLATFPLIALRLSHIPAYYVSAFRLVRLRRFRVLCAFVSVTACAPLFVCVGGFVCVFVPLHLEPCRPSGEA